jgi:hypothetical protein
MRGRVDAALFGIAASALVVVCCAGLPAIGALVGGVAIAAAIGVGGAVLALAALIGAAALLLRARRRRGSCPPPAGGRVQ